MDYQLSELHPRSNIDPQQDPAALDKLSIFLGATARVVTAPMGSGDTPLGHTYNAPDFTDAEWWRKHSNITSTGSLVSIVSRGKGDMPAFRKKLKRGEIKLLVNYVRRFRNSK